MQPRVDRAVRRCGLEPVAARSPLSLSGGQQQRLALASVLALQPRLLLLDEPLAMIDPEGAADLTALVRSLGLTVIWASCRLEELSWCDLWLLLDEGGRGAYQGPPRVEDGWGALESPWTRLARQARSVGCWEGPLPVLEEGLEEGLRTCPSPTRPARERGPVRLQAPGVSFAYAPGEDVLHELDLELYAGQIVGLLGGNGSGKTTLARLLNGLLLPRQGRILLDGLDTAAAPPRQLAARAGYLFQDPRAQVFCPTVGQEVAFGPTQLGWPPEKIAAASQAALRLSESELAPELNPLELSTSQLRWVALASVLALESPLLILDEPSAGLDGPSRQRLVRVLGRLRQAGRSVVVITHDMELAAQECDRLLVLSQGRIWADAAPEDLFAGPAPPGLRPPVANRVAGRMGLAPTICKNEQLFEQGEQPRAENFWG